MASGTQSAAAAETTTAGGKPGALPTAVVIGAQKCGTSGLHYYLSLHPQIGVSEPKELNFFIAERTWGRGVEWYRSHFDPTAPVRVEASPNYTAYPQHDGVPERMVQVIPDARLIFLVRDPIDRIAAHWVHNYSKGRHDGELLETIMRPQTSYIDRSRYAMQLERFLAVYPREQLLVLENEELRHRRYDALRRVFEFVGADPGFTDRRFGAVRHKTRAKTRLTPFGERLDSIRAKRRQSELSLKAWSFARGYWPLGRRIDPPDVMAALPGAVVATLREDARRLAELTGLDLGHWSVWES